jgi:putative cardiolipin synthase
VVIISPYLVPGERGMALLRELAGRGVKLRILTNSLAATDAAAVHIGYARYRPQLLALGVELYEQRPSIGQAPHLGAFGSSRASLHTKALVIDGRTLFIGSMNMDPRSAYENTELGLIIRSTALSGQVLRIFEEQAGKYSYRLGSRDGALVWTSVVDGQTRQWHEEPEATAKQKALLLVLRPFAPEEML